MLTATDGRRRGLFWPLCILGAAAIALVIGAQFYFARETDLAAARREQALVQSGIATHVAELARRTVSETMWDAAVQHLDNAFDFAWAEANIGEYFASTEGFEAAIVLDRDNRPLYAMRDGKSVGANETADLTRAAGSLVDSVRADEQRRGPLAPILKRKSSISTPIMASAISKVGRENFVLTATLVQPDLGYALPKTSRSALVITAKAMDASFMQTLIDRFALEAARIVDGAASNTQGGARAVFRDGQEHVVATLLWKAQTPGTALLRGALPFTLALTAALSALAWGLLRHGQRSAQSLIASEARASHMAYHDPLTGLANRALLADRLAHAVEDQRRSGPGFAVHCIDLDRFKDINDTFGHATGDEFIRDVAQRLVTICGQGDTLARLGGDEFAVIQIGATAETAAALAARIVAKLAEPIELPIGRVFGGCSIGVMLAQDGVSDPNECLRQADLALYRAKDGGRGRFCVFEEEMDAAVRLRRGLQSDLHGALENNEIELLYQPQVNRAGHVFGVEALARWTHPTRGPISPAVFVPLAEECGLIEAFGLFTLRRAFEDSARWPDLQVAINVSAAQLRMASFVPRLADLIMETGIDPTRFELEITEGLLLGDDPQTHAALTRLRAIGFNIALDDFGTGYSSLSYLQRYPINKIKIDRSFITNLGVDTEAEAVVTAIVKLARALGLSVIAEGVETEEQRCRLNFVGCTDVQGFLFGKAVPARDITMMTAKPHARRETEAA